MILTLVLKIRKDQSFDHFILISEFSDLPQGKTSKQYLYVHKDDMALQLLKTQGKGQNSVWLLSTQPEDITGSDCQGENITAKPVVTVKNQAPCFRFQKVVGEILTSEASFDFLFDKLSLSF